jgi:hypothetical protein
MAVFLKEANRHLVPTDNFLPRQCWHRAQLAPLKTALGNRKTRCVPPTLFLRAARHLSVIFLLIYCLICKHRIIADETTWKNSYLEKLNRSTVHNKLRPILNFTPGPQGWISPLGVNLAPRGEICPLGAKFTPSFTPRGVHSLFYLR